MSMSQDPWDRREREFNERPVRSTLLGMTYSTVVIIGILIIVALIGVLGWFFTVATSDIKGQGDAEVTKNSAANRIRAQEGFEARFAGIQSADRNVTDTAVALAADPESRQLQTELRGMRQLCNTAVGEYDAKARQFSSADFRAADLPDKIDLNDPTTDCKE